MSARERMREKLSLYIDGELPDEESELLRIHLARCSSCQAQLEDVLQLEALGFEAFASKAAREAPEEEQALARVPNWQPRLTLVASSSPARHGLQERSSRRGAPRARWHSRVLGAVVATAAVTVLMLYRHVDAPSPRLVSASSLKGDVQAQVATPSQAPVSQEGSSRTSDVIRWQQGGQEAAHREQLVACSGVRTRGLHPCCPR